MADGQPPRCCTDTSTGPPTCRIALSHFPDRSGRLGVGPAAHLRVAHFGDPREGTQLVAPMRALRPAVDTLADLPFTAVGTIHDDPTEPRAGWQGGLLLAELPAAAVGVLLTAAGLDVADPVLCVELRQLGGALARPPVVPNSVGGRDAVYSLFVSDQPGPDETASPRGERLVDALAVYSTGGVALNFLGSVTDVNRIVTAWDAIHLPSTEPGEDDHHLERALGELRKRL